MSSFARSKILGSRSTVREQVERFKGKARPGEHCHNGMPSTNQGAVVMTTPYEIRPIGDVESSLVDREGAPKQGFEGAPDAWLVFNLDVAEGARDLTVSARVFVLTWLHKAQRDVLTVHPRDDPRNPETGVFSSRSQGRPNPTGLHRVRIAAIGGPRVLVRDLEASTGRPSWTLSRYSPVVGERWADRRRSSARLAVW
jgi:tRNA (Thr-GGU) A37 N-methylase